MIAIVTYPAVHRCSCYCADRERERSKALAEALWEVDAMLDGFPAGVDEDADPDNSSPVDAESHTAGLIRQAVRSALEQSK